VKPADFFVGQQLRYNPEFLEEASRSYWSIWAKERLEKQVSLVVQTVTINNAQSLAYIVVRETHINDGRHEEHSTLAIKPSGTTSKFKKIVFLPAVRIPRPPIKIPEGGE